MKDLTTIKADNLRALLREAFEERRTSELVRLLTPDDYLALAEGAEKRQRRDIWLKHKRANKAEFWAKRG